jgi:predicted amidohydrolase YtcJ
MRDGSGQAEAWQTQAAGTGTAHIVLTNARVHTVNDAQPWADAVAIRGEEIVYVGAAGDQALEALVGPATEAHDLGGRVVIPGMVDSHAHPDWVALSAWHVTLPWTDDLDEILAFVGEYAATHPREDVPFLYAEYYPSTLFDTEGPKKGLIDAVVSDRPVLLQDHSDHCSWVNSKMLELLGIDKDTPVQIVPDDPAPQFVRDAAGEPTGWVKEMAWLYRADAMYEAIGWRPPEEVTPEMLHDVTDFLSGRGVVALWDAIGSEATFAAAVALDEQEMLDLYYHGSRRFYSLADLPENIAVLRKWEAKYGGKHVHLDAMKLFLDGTNEIGTSAVLEPFLTGGEDYGELRMSEDDLTACLLLLNAEGLDLHVHLVGDRAFRTACNAVERARSQLGDAWCIQVTLAHCELIDPADMPRVAELGIIVNWSTHWSGGYFSAQSLEWLGSERFDRMYQFNPIIESGAVVAYSSDVITKYEAHRGDPFFGMQVAHTRVDPEFPIYADRPVREPASAKLGLTDLVKGYTLGGAIQLRLSDRMGSIEVGKLANLVVLDKDLFGVPGDEIRTVGPEAVLFEGRLVHGSLESPQPRVVDGR